MKITLLLFLVLITKVIIANPIDTTLAKVVVKNYYSSLKSVTHTKGDIQDAQVNLVHQENFYFKDKKSGDSLLVPLYYVFNIANDSGFVIVSADNSVIPILGYSLTGSYSINNQPPAFISWMKGYANQIIYVKQYSIKADNKIQKKWNDCINNNIQKNKKGKGSVSPLLQTTWDQGTKGDGYNDLCPYDYSLPDYNNSSQYCPTGCGATAMAQIIKYWSYPPHGYGSHEYSSSYGTLSADFENTIFDWSNSYMPLHSSSPAIAKLMYLCGVSIETSYSSDASSSYLTNGSGACIKNALTTFFGYNPSTIQKITRYTDYSNYYSDEQWLTLLETELDASRPILYRGASDEGGHVWVCDGYDSNDRLHMNWGWGGYYNGFYELNILNTALYGYGNGDYSDKTTQVALIGIQHPSCYNWAISPPFQTVPSTGENYSATVSMNSSSGTCSYNITPSDNWIVLDGNVQNGSFNYHVNNNTGDTRTGYIYINDVTDGINNISILTVNQLECMLPPSNDECDNAIILYPNSSCNNITGTTYNATQSQPIPSSGWCSYTYSTYASDVWYKFTATCSNHHIQVQGASDFAPIVEIEDAACGNTLDCDFVGTGDLVDISISCTIGNTYYIRVYNNYGSSIWATGTDFQICVTPSCIANDECYYATPLISENNVNYIPGSTLNSTQSQPPVQCSNFYSPYDAYDVWYKFDAVKNNHIIKVIGASDFEPIIVLEDAACGSALWCDDANFKGSTAIMNVTGLTIGNTYYVRVYGWESYGNFQICVTHGSTGIEDLNFLANLNIYPNPNNGVFTIEIDNLKESYNLEILNTIGLVILNKEIINKVEQLDLSGQAAGVYFVKLQTANNTVVRKIIKQN